MRRQLVVMTGLTGLLFAGTGCSALILAHEHSVGLDGPASSAFPLGASRLDVETKLGGPVKSRTLPDGTRVDSYDYIIRDPNWRGDCLPSRGGSQAPSVCTAAIMSAITLGFVEVAFVPLAIYEVWKKRRTATFTYDPHDRVLIHGAPPAYGPADDAVGTLSLNEIRERCRSDASGDSHNRPGGAIGGPPTPPRSLYDECFVRRLAIWGIQ
jgi:hypothetical protein